MAAPTLAQEYSVSSDATSFYVTDKTGDHASNGTGWGTPNYELLDSALWAVVVRKAKAGDQNFTPVGNQVIYDNAAANTKETIFEFEYLNDGVLEVSMGWLPVSLDGANYKVDYFGGGLPIPDDDYFYWSSGGNVVWQMVSGSPVAVTDLNTLVDFVSIQQILAEDIIMARLGREQQKIYKQYRLNREKDCDDADGFFKELEQLAFDIQGAVYAFYSTLTVQAQDQVETMLDEHSLADQ